MEYKATVRYLHMTPRKVRLLADLIRGKNALRARTELRIAVQRAAGPLGKLLDSAIANAKQQGVGATDALYVKTIRVDQGPKRRTFLPRAFGRVSPLDKRMSHVTLVLEDQGGRVRTAAEPTNANVDQSPFGSVGSERAPKASRPRTSAGRAQSARVRPAPATGRRMFRRKTV